MINVSDPQVSVIIPCYNLGAYLDQAVQSVLDQTYDDFEILLIDDGSSDPATQHLFASYRRPKTRILRTKNQGLAEARNLGVREARGRYVCCLDAADLVETTFLPRAVTALETNPSVAFVSCRPEASERPECVSSPLICDLPDVLVEDAIGTGTVMQRDAVLKVGGFDGEMPLPGYEQWDLAITFLEHGLGGMIIPEHLFRHSARRATSNSCAKPTDH